MKWTLKQAWTLGFQDGEMKAEEDALNLEFRGLNIVETLKFRGLRLHQLPRHGYLLSRYGGHPKHVHETIMP